MSAWKVDAESDDDSAFSMDVDGACVKLSLAILPPAPAQFEPALLSQLILMQKAVCLLHDPMSSYINFPITHGQMNSLCSVYAFSGTLLHQEQFL